MKLEDGLCGECGAVANVTTHQYRAGRGTGHSENETCTVYTCPHGHEEDHYGCMDWLFGSFGMYGDD